MARALFDLPYRPPATVASPRCEPDLDSSITISVSLALLTGSATVGFSAVLIEEPSQSVQRLILLRACQLAIRANPSAANRLI
jgi:hypothetical protein